MKERTERTERTGRKKRRERKRKRKERKKESKKAKKRKEKSKEKKERKKERKKGKKGQKKEKKRFLSSLGRSAFCNGISSLLSLVRFNFFLTLRICGDDFQDWDAAGENSSKCQKRFYGLL